MQVPGACCPGTGETKERAHYLYLVHQLTAVKLFGDFGELEGSLREQLFGFCPVIMFDSSKSRAGESQSWEHSAESLPQAPPLKKREHRSFKTDSRSSYFATQPRMEVLPVLRRKGTSDSLV